MSDLFIVIADRGYIYDSRNLNGNIITHINTAGELKKPFFVVIIL